AYLKNAITTISSAWQHPAYLNNAITTISSAWQHPAYLKYAITTISSAWRAPSVLENHNSAPVKCVAPSSLLENHISAPLKYAAGTSSAPLSPQTLNQPHKVAWQILDLCRRVESRCHAHVRLGRQTYLRVLSYCFPYLNELDKCVPFHS